MTLSQKCQRLHAKSLVQGDAYYIEQTKILIKDLLVRLSKLGWNTCRLYETIMIENTNNLFHLATEQYKPIIDWLQDEGFDVVFHPDSAPPYYAISWRKPQ
jgi:hypothetical protein